MPCVYILHYYAVVAERLFSHSFDFFHPPSNKFDTPPLLFVWNWRGRMWNWDDNDLHPSSKKKKPVFFLFFSTCVAAHSMKGEKKRNYFIRRSKRKHPLHPVAIEWYCHNLYRTTSKMKLGGVFDSYEDAKKKLKMALCPITSYRVVISVADMSETNVTAPQTESRLRFVANLIRYFRSTGIISKLLIAPPTRLDKRRLQHTLHLFYCN